MVMLRDIQRLRETNEWLIRKLQEKEAENMRGPTTSTVSYDYGDEEDDEEEEEDEPIYSLMIFKYKDGTEDSVKVTGYPNDQDTDFDGDFFYVTDYQDNIVMIKKEIISKIFIKQAVENGSW
jgi:hypothetical protein